MHCEIVFHGAKVSEASMRCLRKLSAFSICKLFFIYIIIFILMLVKKILMVIQAVAFTTCGVVFSIYFRTQIASRVLYETH